MPPPPPRPTLSPYTTLFRSGPGVYHSVLPAWGDANLRHLAGHISSPLFLSHVRATSGTPIQETNCHPFSHGRWLFVHNRSEEHTSELQSRFDLVCRLLLEKN